MEAQQGGVLVGCFTGGAAGSAQIHDRLDSERDRPADFQGYCNVVRTEHRCEHRVRGHSFPWSKNYHKWLLRLQEIVGIRSATREQVEFIRDSPVRVGEGGGNRFRNDIITCLVVPLYLETFYTFAPESPMKSATTSQSIRCLTKFTCMTAKRIIRVLVPDHAVPCDRPAVSGALSGNTVRGLPAL